MASSRVDPHYLVAFAAVCPNIFVLLDTRHVISISSVTPIRGEITEIIGGTSSGRTSHLLTCLRDVVSRGETAALVDTEETFDPRSAARAGLDLRRLLWVRCRGHRDVALRAADMLVRCPGFALVALDLGERMPRLPPTLAFRLKFAVRRTDVALLIVGRRRLTGSSAALAIETLREKIEWVGPGPAATRLARVRTTTRVLRSRRAAPGWPPSLWWSA
ncbi:MAG: hypothetical protein DMD96_16055 [Candidatus Rokuibacteriota bacterium]|nr:MAG: hypothetical protein DMD96_16055 [Candidatus Rokubacteria bacterium]